MHLHLFLPAVLMLRTERAHVLYVRSVGNLGVSAEGNWTSWSFLFCCRTELKKSPGQERNVFKQLSKVQVPSTETRTPDLWIMFVMMQVQMEARAAAWTENHAGPNSWNRRWNPTSSPLPDKTPSHKEPEQPVALQALYPSSLREKKTCPSWTLKWVLFLLISTRPSAVSSLVGAVELWAYEEDRRSFGNIRWRSAH